MFACYTRISDNEIHITVFINPNVKIGQLVLGSLREFIDHEVLHSVRDQNKLVSGRPSEYEDSLKHIRYDDSLYKDRLNTSVKNRRCSPEYLMYRLFTDNELYALVNQMIQSLKNINATEHSEYPKDVKITNVYKEYKVLLDYLPKLKKQTVGLNRQKKILH